jgi:uncharacterized protein (TIGR01777 family)
MTNEKIAISGASGFIGTYLTNYFRNINYEIVSISRDLLEDNNSQILAKVLTECSIIINLAGAPINRRWSESYKEELYNSRINTTKKIVDAINSNLVKPHTFISASAVGYYPSSGCYTEENSIKGNSYLSYLCEEWENEAKKISTEVRLIITRFGVVLSPRGGAFKLMSLPARLRFATIIGNGNQYFPWIDILDLADAMKFIIDNDTVNDIVNFVSPEQITNKEFTRAAAQHYHSIMTLKIPRSFFKLLLGEASLFITEGQCVYPAKLLKAGYKYKSSSLQQFFDRI